MQKIVSWIKNNQNQSWFDLLRLNVDSPYFTNLYGVYIIWYTSPGGAKVIKVGSGSIGEKLKSEKLNPNITRYSQLGQIKVTWAIINSADVQGVVAYLNSVYSPIITEPVQYGVILIKVNLI